jgi:tetratricopeptide (TPR) repeat protein
MLPGLFIRPKAIPDLGGDCFRRDRDDARHIIVGAGMKPFCIVLALLLSVCASRAEPLETFDIGQLNDGIIAQAHGDFVEAIELLKPIAAIDHPFAQLILGRAYLKIAKNPGDCERGMTSLARSAERGNADAAFELGELYRHGECIAQNEKTALNWYVRAATIGHMEAADAAAEIYADASQRVPDYSEALRWSRRAVKYFDHVACYRIGMSYARGTGVKVDNMTAFKWLELAVVLTPVNVPAWQETIEARDRVREQLMPKQVADAQHDAEQILAVLVEQFKSPAHARKVDTMLAFDREDR